MMQRLTALLFSAAIISSAAMPAFSKSTLPPSPFGGNGSGNGEFILSQKEPTPQPPSTPAPSPNCDPETETAVPDGDGYICIKTGGNLVGVIWNPPLPEPDPIPTIKLTDNKSANDDEEYTPVYPDLPPAPTTPNNLFILAHRGSGRANPNPEDPTTQKTKSVSNSYNEILQILK